MSGGARAAPPPTLEQIRAHARDQLGALPAPLRRLEAFSYPVEIAASVCDLADRLDRAQTARASARP
jgi:nicotinate phosphoribosyltransferase